MPKPFRKPAPPPEPPPKKYVCIACSDTGFNSRGGWCTPCMDSGRVRVAEQPPAGGDDELLG